MSTTLNMCHGGHSDLWSVLPARAHQISLTAAVLPFFRSIAFDVNSHHSFPSQRRGALPSWRRPRSPFFTHFPPPVTRIFTLFHTTVHPEKPVFHPFSRFFTQKYFFPAEAPFASLFSPPGRTVHALSWTTHFWPRFGHALSTIRPWTKPPLATLCPRSDRGQNRRWPRFGHDKWPLVTLCPRFYAIFYQKNKKFCVRTICKSKRIVL